MIHCFKVKYITYSLSVSKEMSGSMGGFKENRNRNDRARMVYTHLMLSMIRAVFPVKSSAH